MTVVPAGLHVVVHPPRRAPTGPSVPDLAGSVVLVHGSLDRGDSFRRVARRLEEMEVVTYDRRGYQRSRPAGLSPGLGGHVADLLAVVEKSTRRSHGRRPVVVGHSLGGLVVLAAALERPAAFWSVGAYEPPLPWLPASPDGGDGPPGGRRAPLDDHDPGGEAERFFRRMVGDAAWERLSETARRQRRLDGPALIADLRSMRGPAPFDVADLTVPAVFGRGGSSSAARHRRGVGWLAAQVPGSTLFEIPQAGHGAHLSHPDAFASLVREACRAGAGVPPAAEAARARG